MGADDGEEGAEEDGKIQQRQALSAEKFEGLGEGVVEVVVGGGDVAAASPLSVAAHDREDGGDLEVDVNG